MFKILPTLYKAKLDAENGRGQLVGLEFNNTKRLFDEKVVSQQEVAINQAKLSKALADRETGSGRIKFHRAREHRSTASSTAWKCDRAA